MSFANDRTRKGTSTASRPKFSIAPSFDALPETEKLMVMAVSILVNRIRSLPPEDQTDLFELLEEISKTNDPEEMNSIARTMQEILSQTPFSSTAMDLPPQPTIPPRSKKWAETVGNKIRKLRESLGLNQLQLAEKAGLTQSHISRLESATHVATHKTLQKIAKALNVPVSDLDPCMD